MTGTKSHGLYLRCYPLDTRVMKHERSYSNDRLHGNVEKGPLGTRPVKQEVKIDALR